MPEGMDVIDLAEPDIEIVAPTTELSALCGFEIPTAGIDVAPMEQTSSWKSEQTWSQTWSQDREGVEVVPQYECMESFNTPEQPEVGVSDGSIILAEAQLTSGSKAGTDLQPHGMASVLAPCELEGIYLRELEGPDNEAPLGIDIDVLETSAPLAPCVLEHGVEITATTELGVEGEEMYMESEVVRELAGPDVEVIDEIEAFNEELRAPTVDCWGCFGRDHH